MLTFYHIVSKHLHLNFRVVHTFAHLTCQHNTLKVKVSALLSVNRNRPLHDSRYIPHSCSPFPQHFMCNLALICLAYIDHNQSPSQYEPQSPKHHANSLQLQVIRTFLPPATVLVTCQSGNICIIKIVLICSFRGGIHIHCPGLQVKCPSASASLPLQSPSSLLNFFRIQGHGVEEKPARNQIIGANLNVCHTVPRFCRLPPKQI